MNRLSVRNIIIEIPSPIQKKNNNKYNLFILTISSLALLHYQYSQLNPPNENVSSFHHH